VGVTPEDAEAALFPEGPEPSGPRCADLVSAARTRCLVALRFAGHPREAEDALALWDEAGSVAGLEREHTMNGGFRGTIHIVPELPVGPHARHLGWVLAAARDHQDFFTKLASGGGPAPRYRYKDLTYHFLRSVGRTTPSAYASPWRVGYNVSGSLHRSAAAVSETLFHEVFHLNDADHGGWSARALADLYDGLVARCGTSIACLQPFAPNHTLVRGGTYYAFQPGGGVEEYAAELAIRYFREHRRILGLPVAGGMVERPFKCGPPENQRAWAELAREFFGGVDLVPPCSPTPP
jgi:hypothetical protein